MCIFPFYHVIGVNCMPSFSILEQFLHQLNTWMKTWVKLEHMDEPLQCA